MSPEWFQSLDKLSKRPIIVKIDGKEVARAVAKDTKDGEARK
jgi:hypothetical protein